MKFLLILLIPIITKKSQVLSAAVKGNTDIQGGLSPTDADVKKRVVHQSCCNLLQGWDRPKGDIQLPAGNAIFLHNLLTFLKNFQDDEQNDCHAKIMKVNFRSPKETEKKINEYVKNKTEGKIKDVLKDLSKDTKVVLINHAVFKGEWQEPFDPDNTKVEKFFVDEKTTVDVPLMHLTGRFNTYRDTDLPCTVVELPYKDNVSMIIAMAEPGRIHEVEQGMSSETIQRWKTSTTETSIQLSIPKSSIDSTIDTENPLLKLGNKTVFTDSADFSGITNKIGLKAGKVLHRVTITVDEKGTEAAEITVLEAVPRRLPTQVHHRAKRSVDEKRTEAAKDAVMEAVSMNLPIQINFNRPFLYSIYDEKRILFMGKLVNPKK